MDDNIDFKDLWKKQSAAQPDKAELFAKLTDLRRKGLRKLIITNVLLISTSIFIILIVYLYQPQMITTKVGTILVLLAMVIFLFAYNKIAPSFNSIAIEKSAHEYLQDLIRIKSKQQFLHTTMMNIYYIMLSSGLFLYMIEPTLKMSLIGRILAYGITFAWMMFSWFYIRPRSLRKQQSRVNELISQFEKMDNQLTNE